MGVSKYSPWYNWSQFLDWSTLILIVAAGIFTLTLFYQTCNYVQKRTSLIDETKRTRKNK